MKPHTMTSPRHRIFLLSPAHCGGKRAQMLMRDEAEFDLAVRLRSDEGAPLGEVFAFLSGLYFRGKLAYARAFGRAPAGAGSALVITTNQGLLSVDTTVHAGALRAFGECDISTREPRYLRPLQRDVGKLAGLPDTDIVLLGSIATGKYVDVLLDALDERLLFPLDFIGRGDMSRGGLILRCVESGTELTCAPVRGTHRHGARPPRLAPLRRRSTLP